MSIWLLSILHGTKSYTLDLNSTASEEKTNLLLDNRVYIVIMNTVIP